MSMDNHSQPYPLAGKISRRIDPPDYTPPQEYFESLTRQVMAQVGESRSPKHADSPKDAFDHVAAPHVSCASPASRMWVTRLSVAMVAAACLGFTFLIDRVISFRLNQDNTAIHSSSVLAEGDTYYADEAYDDLMLNDYLLCDYAEESQ